MEKKYVLHRISHEYSVAQKLLKHGYLSIGFSQGLCLFESARKNDRKQYDLDCKKIYKGQAWWEKTAIKRNQPWRFLTLSIGDIVVVPLPYGKFSICEVDREPMKITDLDLSELGDDNKGLTLKDGLLYNEDGHVDFGFLVHVTFLKEDLSRGKYADAALTSRMKFRQTNTDINDIAEHVERVIKKDTPINLYNNVIEDISSPFLGAIKRDSSDSKFEKLVKWYMEQQGFKAEIPPKNFKGKKDYADADIVAASELLKIIICIQVKFFEGVCGEWAIEQISKYTEQKMLADTENDYTYIQWVVSTADDYSEKAKSIAVEKNVRLITGLEFSQMLLDSGVNTINDALV